MVWKRCKGCGKYMDIASNRALCRFCRKNPPEVMPLWTKRKRINLEKWRKVKL